MEHLGKHIREWWFMIVFIGMVIVSWTTFSNRLTQLEKRVSEIETIIGSFDQIRIDIAVIKEKITNIEKKI